MIFASIRCGVMSPWAGKGNVRVSCSGKDNEKYFPSVKWEERHGLRAMRCHADVDSAGVFSFQVSEAGDRCDLIESS